MTDQEQAVYLLELIEDRFAPFAHVAGPLLAGKLQHERSTGNLYLTEARTWLFLEAGTDEFHTFDRQELSDSALPIRIVSNLLNSVAQATGAFHSHLVRVVKESEDPLSMLGFYLSDSTASVVDAIALRAPAPEQPTSIVSEDPPDLKTLASEAVKEEFARQTADLVAEWTATLDERSADFRHALTLVKGYRVAVCVLAFLLSIETGYILSAVLRLLFKHK